MDTSQKTSNWSIVLTLIVVIGLPLLPVSHFVAWNNGYRSGLAEAAEALR